jgi:16S rRNA (cytidine1402-2'-O)-methyltransferase
LRKVDYVLCEDTRRAAKLKNRYPFDARLISFHEHNEKSRIPKILSLMKEGKMFALISDAGTPVLSDPGLLLIQALIENNLEFTLIPGASAIQSALVLSGFPPEPFTFFGFLPSTSGSRKTALEKLKTCAEHTLVLFESPERLLGLLRELGEVLGDRDVAVCRELTKVHEEVIRGKLSELLSSLSSRKLLGEFTVVIAPGEGARVQMDDRTVRMRFEHLLNQGLSRKDALKKLVKESGRHRNDLYSLLMK